MNALCLLSPSIIEGFGIPVLDACCLGLKCYASDCNSHKEIQKLYDFSNFLEICETNSIKWNEIFNNEDLTDQSAIDVTILNRIYRYEKFNRKIKNQFRIDISNLINNI